MDHVWQIGVFGPPEHAMLAAYTTLGYLAACTTRVELVRWVTAVVGIGAAWNEDEARGLGAAVPAHRGALRAAGGGVADLPANVQ